MTINSFDAIYAAELARKTNDAYSFDRYGYDEWFAITCFLWENNYTQEAIEEVVRSKHMRWSADAREDATLNGFKEYYKKYKTSINEFLDGELSGWYHP